MTKTDVIIGAIVLAIGAGLTYTLMHSVRTNGQIAAAADTVRITDTVRLAAAAAEGRSNHRADSARQSSNAARATSDASDRAVDVVSDSQVIVHRADTTVVFAAPPELTKDLIDLRETVGKQAVTIHLDSLARDSSAVRQRADSTAIAKRDRLIALLRPRPVSLAIVAGYGCGARGCGPQLTVGVRYDLRLPKLSLPFIR